MSAVARDILDVREFIGEMPMEVAPAPEAIAQDLAALSFPDPARDTLALSQLPSADYAALVQMREEEALKAARESFAVPLEGQLAELETALGRLSSESGDASNQEAIDQLEAQIRSVNATLADIRSAKSFQALYGSAMIALAAAGAAAGAISAASVAAASGKGEEMAEISLEHIEKMGINDMANRFTASHFANMSDEQLAAVGRKVDKHVEESLARDNERHNEIENRAAELGKSDELDEYRSEREILEEEERKARANGDKLALAKIAAAKSQNAVHAAETIGDEALAAKYRKQAEEDRAALDLKIKEEATKEAKANGLNKEETEALINERVKASNTEYQNSGNTLSKLHASPNGADFSAGQTTNISNVPLGTIIEARLETANYTKLIEVEQETVSKKENQFSSLLTGFAAPKTTISYDTEADDKKQEIGAIMAPTVHTAKLANEKNETKGQVLGS